MTQLNERTLNRLLTVKFANIGGLLTLQNVLYTYMINAPYSFLECIKRVEEITGTKLIMYNVDLTDKEAIQNIFKKVTMCTANI